MSLVTAVVRAEVEQLNATATINDSFRCSSTGTRARSSSASMPRSCIGLPDPRRVRVGGQVDRCERLRSVYRVSNVGPRPIDPRRLEPLVGRDASSSSSPWRGALRERLDGRRIVNINSTANGGGVAEMLATLIGYARGAGLQAEWLVIRGDPDFFAVTKRIHNGLYGSPGDGDDLGSRERSIYEQDDAGEPRPDTRRDPWRRRRDRPRPAACRPHRPARRSRAPRWSGAVTSA